MSAPTLIVGLAAVALTSVRSKALVLLSWIIYIIVPPLFFVLFFVLCLVLVVLCSTKVSFLVLLSYRWEERSGCLKLLHLPFDVMWLLLPWVGLQCAIVAFSGHTHLLSDALV